MLPKSFSILLFCISISIVKAQTPVVDKVDDSLKNELNRFSKKTVSVGRDSQIIKTLAKLFMNLPSKEIEKREFYNDSMKRFAPKTAWNKAFAYQMYISGFMHTFKGENTLAFNDIEKAMLEFRKHKDEEYYQNSAERLSILMGRNMMLKPITDERLQKKYLNYIGERLNEAKTKFPDRLAGSYASFGQFYLMKRDWEKSAEYYQEEMSHAKLNTNINLDFFEYNAGLFFSKGLCALYLNPNDKEAKQTIKEVIEKCQTEKHNNYEKYLLLIMIHYVGNYYCEKNDYQNALKIGLIGKKIEDPPQMPFYVYLVDNVLAKAYKGLNQPVKAFQYFEKVKEYEEKSGAETLSGNLAEWQLKYDDVKQKSIIQSLENEKLLKENERQDLLRNVLIISLLAGLGFVFYIFKNNKQLKEKNLLLENKNREIEEALYKGQSLERKRVATELHDSLSSKISGIKMRLEAVQPHFTSEKQQKIYQSSVSALAEVYTDVRLISHNLLPAELELRGLEKAVQNFVNELNSLDKTTFDCEISENFGRFSYKIEYEIFSIILELSNNIMKHSQAKVAMISLQNDVKLLKLEVSDNGIGFNEQNFIEGMGIENIKSRVNSLKGKMEVLNNNGVSVKIVVPIT